MEQIYDCAQRLVEGQSIEEASRATGVAAVQVGGIRRQLIKAGLLIPEGSGVPRRSGVFIERLEQLIRSSGGFLRKALHLAEGGVKQTEAPPPGDQGSGAGG